MKVIFVLIAIPVTIALWALAIMLILSVLEEIKGVKERLLKYSYEKGIFEGRKKTMGDIKIILHELGVSDTDIHDLAEKIDQRDRGKV